MDIIKFRDIIFKKAKEKNFSDCEIYVSRNKNFRIKIFEGQVNSYENTDTLGVSFRGHYNGVMGYSYSEKVSEDIIDFLIDKAKENAEIIEDKDVTELYPGDTDYEKVELYDEELPKISAERKIEDALKMEKLIYSLDKRVKSVDGSIIGTGENESYIYNTLGLNLSEKSNFCVAYPIVRVEENGETKVDADSFIGNDYSKLDIEKISKKATEKAISHLGAKSVSSGKYKIVFENESFVSILSAFSGIFYAESVQKGFSLLKGKLNQKIASEKVTIRDDALLDKMLGSCSFDSEGVKTSNKAVVENGVLKTFLYNLKTAKKDGVKSTGNGFKYGYKSYVGTSTTNFYLDKGEKSFDELLEMAENGILITDVSGLHAGINPISGDFSLAAEGFLIKDSKKSSPVEQIIVSGNYFELLKNIIEVGSDLDFSSGSTGSPSVYVGELNISGN